MALQMAGSQQLAPMTPPKPIGQAASSILGQVQAGGGVSANAKPIDGAPPPVQGGLPQAAAHPSFGSPSAMPIGAPKPQTAPTSQALYSPHILTKTDSGASNPWMAPPTAGSPGASSPLPLAAGAGASPYANISTNVPGSNTDYTNKTITPGAGVDRLALAKSNFQNFHDSTEPEFQAALRDASQQVAGGGQIGSGMARGRLGDIGLARARDLQSAETSNLNNATEGSIGDSYNNIGIAQQQQGFQAGQQQSAFNQATEQQQLEEMLRNGSFGRSATTLGLGEQGNPSDIAMQLSGMYGNQASGAGQSAGSLLGNQAYGKYLKPNPGAPPSDGVPYNVNDPNQNIYAGMPS